MRHIDGIEDIAQWAAFHHEGVNGRGYPFHPKERELSVDARIIAVARVEIIASACHAIASDLE